MHGKDLASLSAQDEERMIKQLNEKQLRDRKADDEKSMKHNHAKNDNLNYLKRQMIEKQDKARLEKLQDDAFAELIKQKVKDGEILDDKKKREIASHMKINQGKLKGQMVENQEKARYGILMTEHERKVNDNDIEAYENMENKVYGQIPGMGGSYERDRQLKMVNSNMGRGGSMMAQHSKHAEVIIDGSSGHNYQQSMTPMKGVTSMQQLPKLNKNQKSTLQLGGLH
jgi:hypothetical protein